MHYSPGAKRITVIGIPVVGALFWLRFHRRHRQGAARSQGRACKLQGAVATSFVSVSYLRDVEDRIMGHLEKIKKKIDRMIEQRHPPAE